MVSSMAGDDWWSGRWLGWAQSLSMIASRFGSKVLKLVVLGMKPSWWHKRAVERKLCALSSTMTTLVGVAFFVKTLSWCSFSAQVSGEDLCSVDSTVASPSVVLHLGGVVVELGCYRV